MSATNVTKLEKEKTNKRDFEVDVRISVKHPEITFVEYHKQLNELASKADDSSVAIILRDIASIIGDL